MEYHYRKCAICNSENNILAFEQKFDNLIEFKDDVYIQKIVICRDCGFVFNNPSPSYSELSKHYTSWSNYEMPQSKGIYSNEMANKWLRTYEFVKKGFPDDFRGNVLEVGCATAFGLSIFKSNGWDVLGLDPSQKASEIANKQYGIRVINSLFDINLFSGKKYDLIIFSHVLEHIISPGELVKDLVSILNPNGLIYIEVPDMSNPDVPMGYFTYEHLNYFTPTALTNLMGENGYNLVCMEQFLGSMEIEPYYPVISALYKPQKANHQKYVLINDFKISNNAVENYIGKQNLQGKKIDKKINAVVEKYAAERIGLWGAGIHTSQLLSLTKLKNIKIGYIFDNDQKKHGSSLHDVIVSGLSENIENHVDCIIISSRAYEREIYAQIKFLENFGVEILRIYEE